MLDFGDEEAESMRLEDCVNIVNSGFIKIKKEDVLRTGKTPVISQEFGDYIGFTNEEKGCVDNETLPVILFGDHNLLVKYIEKPFFIGADGVKILKVKNNIVSKYIYFYLLSNFFIKAVRHKMSGDFYTRHWSYAKEVEIPIPSLETQQQIVDEMEKQIAYIKQTEVVMATQQEKIKKVMSKIWQKHSTELSDNDYKIVNKSVFDAIIQQASKPLK